MTIRKKRKIPIKVGDALQLYTGQRTKQCRKLADAVCTQTLPIKITKSDRIIKGFRTDDIWFQDGFDSRASFFKFFEQHHGLPFNGVLIKWRWV